MKFLLFTVLLGTVTLARADAVRLQINGPDGKPVAGAQIRVQEASGQWFERHFEPPRDLNSDENGVAIWESNGSLAPTTDGKARRENFAFARVLAPGLAVGGANLKAGGNVITLGAPVALASVVADENQKPIAGARLRVTALTLKGEDGKKRVLSLQEALALETVTDAQGRWRVESLPVGATASFEAEAPGFQNLKFDVATSLTATARSAPPIFLRRGGVIKGRIVRPDGSGAANVQFFAGDHLNQPRTDAQGRFEVDGVKPGNIYLQITRRSQNLPFVLPLNAVDGLGAGEVRDIGDWKAEKGVRVRGRVVDGAQKPVAGAQVSLSGGSYAQSEADENGAFDFIADEGASMLSVYAPGYVSKQQNDLPPAKDGVVDLGATTLARAATISGVLKNQAGTPLVNTAINAARNGNNAERAETNEQGEFEFDALAPGTYKLVSIGKTIVSGADFTVKAADNEPLNVVVEGTSLLVPDVPLPVATRVVDSEGAPVAGAQVAFKFDLLGGGYRNYNALSDETGALNLEVNGAGKKLEITDIYRPGYVTVTPALELENGAYRGDIRLQKRGLSLRGRVINAAGKPLAKVAVALQSGDDLPVTTNEQGEFALTDAPQTGVTILASDGARLGAFKVEKAGQKIEIQLPDAAPVDKQTLADQITPRARFGYNLRDKWDDFGSARIDALALAILADGKGEGSGSLAWNQFLLKMARRDPARFVAREAALRERNPANNAEPFNETARLARAAAGTRAQKEGVETWLAAERPLKRELNADNVTALLMRAEIAARLGDEAGAQFWLDYAAQIADYVPERGNNSWEWGHAAARVGPQSAIKFVESWTPAAQMQILWSALREHIDANNGAQAKADWERMRTLVAAAEAAPPDEATRVEGFISKPKESLAQAQGDYAAFLSRTDPAAAYQLAQAIPLDNPFRVMAMPVIGKNAAKSGQLDVARLALRASFETNMSNTNYGADAARVAATFDEVLAAELFARNYAKSSARDAFDRGQWTLADYAEARADGWPGETRLLAERAWPGQLENALKPRDPNDYNYDGADESTIQLVGATARVAPARALEMAEQLPERKQLRGKALGAILSALLAE